MGKVKTYIFHVSKLEGLVKGFVRKVYLENLNIDLDKSMEGSVKTLDLANLHIQMEENGIKIEERMRHIENTMGHMEDSIVKRIVKLLQNLEGNIPKGDDVG